jgi:hypothetical protein
MSRSRRSPYHSDLGWILGFAFEDTLTRPARLAQEFTFVRCHGSPRASSPHGLTAPAMPPLDAIRCVQLPPARGCYQPAPQRTLTSNPVPMPGTPSSPLRGKSLTPTSRSNQGHPSNQDLLMIHQNSAATIQTCRLSSRSDLSIINPVEHSRALQSLIFAPRTSHPPQKAEGIPRAHSRWRGKTCR